MMRLCSRLLPVRRSYPEIAVFARQGIFDARVRLEGCRNTGPKGAINPKGTGGALFAQAFGNSGCRLAGGTRSSLYSMTSRSYESQEFFICARTVSNGTIKNEH